MIEENEGFFNKISRIDLFPQTQSPFLHRTRSGGLLSMLVLGLLSFIVLIEVQNYLWPTPREHFELDRTIGGSSLLDLDISVATKCSKLIVFMQDEKEQKKIVNDLVALKDEQFPVIISNDEDNGKNSTSVDVPSRKKDSVKANVIEGCRIKGKVPLDKVGGAFVIIPANDALGELGILMNQKDDSMNFSHHIHHLSFGRDYPGMKNPLNGATHLDLKVREHYSYLLSIITTTYHDSVLSDHLISTSQYSVRSFKTPNREGQLANPGLFFVYDYEPLAMVIRRERPSLLRFLINLMAIVGGVYSCAGIVVLLFKRGIQIVEDRVMEKSRAKSLDWDGSRRSSDASSVRSRFLSQDSSTDA